MKIFYASVHGFLHDQKEDPPPPKKKLQRNKTKNRNINQRENILKLWLTNRRYNPVKMKISDKGEDPYNKNTVKVNRQSARKQPLKFKWDLLKTKIQVITQHVP